MKNAANWAAVAAFVAGFGGIYLYTSRLAVRLAGGSPVTVLMVTSDLAAGQTLKEEHLAQVNVPSTYLDTRRVLAKEKDKVLGVAIESALHAGDGLIWSDLRDGTAHRSLAELIAPGQRAYSVSAKANPLGRLLQVGDYVDVLLKRAGESEVVLERVVVLTVGGRLSSEEHQTEGKLQTLRNDTGVTLSVSQKQATELFVASARGELTLILRNPEDQSRRQAVAAPPVVARAIKAAEAEIREIEHVR